MKKQPKTLPYDFIPFIEGNQYYYPWKTEDLPSHDKREEIYKSGTIHYTVTPKSPLVMELRKKSAHPSQYYVSGSALRGKIRSNVEILSGSYPEFVDKSEIDESSLKSLRLLNMKKETKLIDYTNAIFGYANSNDDQNFAYKSRVIFSHLDVIGNLAYDEKSFILMSPAKHDKYINKVGLKKVGYKYYPITRTHNYKPKSTKNNNEIKSNKFVFQDASKQQGFYFKGEIKFHNLQDDEIGLLLLALKIDLLLLEDNLPPLFEAIGGVKGYGYGKVSIDIEKLEIENDGVSFNELLDCVQEIKTYKSFDDLYPFIQSFVDAVGGLSFFDHVHIKTYVNSKHFDNIDKLEFKEFNEKDQVVKQDQAQKMPSEVDKIALEKLMNKYNKLRVSSGKEKYRRK